MNDLIDLNELLNSSDISEKKNNWVKQIKQIK